MFLKNGRRIFLQTGLDILLLNRSDLPDTHTLSFRGSPQGLSPESMPTVGSSLIQRSKPSRRRVAIQPTTVMPRECGASSIPETSVIYQEVAAYWIARSSRALTAE
jgi:hypothetical protein